jgi:hypothetical protein
VGVQEMAGLSALLSQMQVPQAARPGQGQAPQIPSELQHLAQQQPQELAVPGFVGGPKLPAKSLTKAKFLEEFRASDGSMRNIVKAVKTTSGKMFTDPHEHGNAIARAMDAGEEPVDIGLHLSGRGFVSQRLEPVVAEVMKPKGDMFEVLFTLGKLQGLF